MPADRILTGLALRLVAVFFLATMSALIKWTETHGGTLIEILFFRQLFALPVVVAWLAIGPGLGSIRTNRIGAHVWRTVVGQIGMVLNFSAILLLPLAEATTFQFTVPIFATILGALVLGEVTGWHRWAAVVTGFLGVVIVAHPGGGHVSLAGAAVGLTAASVVAWVSIMLRDLGKTESAGTTVFWFTLLPIPVLGIAYLFDFHPHAWTVWAVLVTIGLVGAVAQLALTAALRFGPLSAIMPMDYSNLIWATLYGWLIFSVWPTPYTWIGAPVIIASGLYIVWREHRLGRRESPVSAVDTAE